MSIWTKLLDLLWFIIYTYIGFPKSMLFVKYFPKLLSVFVSVSSFFSWTLSNESFAPTLWWIGHQVTMCICTLWAIIYFTFSNSASYSLDLSSQEVLHLEFFSSSTSVFLPSAVLFRASTESESFQSPLNLPLIQNYRNNIVTAQINLNSS